MTEEHNHEQYVDQDLFSDDSDIIIEDHQLTCTICHGTGIDIHIPGREPCKPCDGYGFFP